MHGSETSKGTSAWEDESWTWQQTGIIHRLRRGRAGGRRWNKRKRRVHVAIWLQVVDVCDGQSLIAVGIFNSQTQPLGETRWSDAGWWMWIRMLWIGNFTRCSSEILQYCCGSSTRCRTNVLGFHIRMNRQHPYIKTVYLVTKYNSL